MGEEHVNNSTQMQHDAVLATHQSRDMVVRFGTSATPAVGEHQAPVDSIRLFESISLSKSLFHTRRA